jgi:hypothetical protein
MAKKNHAPGPVPPANRSKSGPPDGGLVDDMTKQHEAQTGGDQEHGDQHGTGGYVGKGEASFHQPGGKNDADRHSGRQDDK